VKIGEVEEADNGEWRSYEDNDRRRRRRVEGGSVAVGGGGGQKGPARQQKRYMATKVDPPNGISPPGKHHYMLWRSVFEIDTKYIPIKPIGKGAYGVVCSARNSETGEKIAIKKITNAFENTTDARRTLREILLLRHLFHENIIAVKDIMKPVGKYNFNDVYLVYELMDTDLHQIIRSSQALTDEHCQYFIYQVWKGSL
jgi:serine/threonine protein kinase